MALRFYADDNNDQLPAEFEAASRFLPVKTGTKTNLTTSLFEIVCQGPLSKIKNPAQTIVIRERQPVQTPEGKWIKTYGFADGHTETHTEAENSFDAWEAQRMASLPPSSQ